MSTYRINPISGGSGFKVNVSDEAGSLRVVGIFPTERVAAAWITADRGMTETCDNQTTPQPALLT